MLTFPLGTAAVVALAVDLTSLVASLTGLAISLAADAAAVVFAFGFASFVVSSTGLVASLAAVAASGAASGIAGGMYLPWRRK